MESNLIKIEEEKADYLCKIIDKEDKKYILHIEFQSTNNFYMNFRMLRYLIELHKKEKLPVIQLVVYIGKDSMNMKNGLKFEAYDTSIDYKYQLVDMSKLSCEKFLNSKNGGLISLAILCDYEIYGKEKLVRNIREKLESQCNGDYNWVRDQFYRVEILSNLRENMFEIVKKEEEMISDRIRIEDLPSYHIGREREYQRGAILLQQERDKRLQERNKRLQEREKRLILIQKEKKQRTQRLEVEKMRIVDNILLFLEFKFQIKNIKFKTFLQTIKNKTKLNRIKKEILKIDDKKKIENFIKECLAKII